MKKGEYSLRYRQCKFCISYRGTSKRGRCYFNPPVVIEVQGVGRTKRPEVASDDFCISSFVRNIEYRCENCLNYLPCMPKICEKSRLTEGPKDLCQDWKESNVRKRSNRSFRDQ